MRCFIPISAGSGLAAAALACSLLLSSCPAGGIVALSSYPDGLGVPNPSIAGLPDGSYSGAASVYVPVGSFAMEPRAAAEVTIAGGRIASVVMTEPKSFPGGIGRFDELAARVVAAQSVDVDTVSGASFTSKAFLKAIAKAVCP